MLSTSFIYYFATLSMLYQFFVRDLDLATGSKNREVFHNPKLISRVLNCVNNV
jgi:hypothetical protein